MEMKTKVCTKCGIEKQLNEFYYQKLRKCYMNSCKKCNSVVCAKYQIKRKRSEDAYKQIFTERAAEKTRYARIKGIPIMKKLGRYLYRLWEDQKGVCAYTGRKMDLFGYHEKNPNAVAIDRTIPEKGYVEGNIQLCCAFINRIKVNYTWEELKEHCAVLLKIADRYIQEKEDLKK